MKKLFTTDDYKRINKKRSKDALRKLSKKKRRHSSYVSPIRHSKIEDSVPDFKRPQYVRTVPPLKVLKAPENFSLVLNTDEVIDYFNLVHKELYKGNRVLFDISEICTLTPDTIALQIAKIKDSSFHHGSQIYGNEPINDDLKSLFVQSGLYDYVSIKGPKPTNGNKLLLHKLTDNKVEPDIAKEACLLGLRHTFKNEEIFEPLYNILIEIMQNTNNHAGNIRGKYDWWLHVYNHPDSLKTSYTFLDLGVGIFESIPVKSFKRDFLNFFGFTSNLDLVPKLLAGEIRSRTTRPERGKGIPQVFDCSSDDTFDKFVLISNDICADLKSQTYRKLNSEFKGTLYYWSINNIQ